MTQEEPKHYELQYKVSTHFERQRKNREEKKKKKKKVRGQKIQCGTHWGSRDGVYNVFLYSPDASHFRKQVIFFITIILTNVICLNIARPEELGL